jgi:hypothetical protein
VYKLREVTKLKKISEAANSAVSGAVKDVVGIF